MSWGTMHAHDEYQRGYAAGLKVGGDTERAIGDHKVNTLIEAHLDRTAELEEDSSWFTSVACRQLSISIAAPFPSGLLAASWVTGGFFNITVSHFPSSSEAYSATTVISSFAAMPILVVSIPGRVRHNLRHLNTSYTCMEAIVLPVQADARLICH